MNKYYILSAFATIQLVSIDKDYTIPKGRGLFRPLVISSVTSSAKCSHFVRNIVISSDLKIRFVRPSFYIIIYSFN